MAAIAACNTMPDYVVPPDEMAELMADIRIADAVVAVQHNDYESDASKLALKRAVLDRHGISEEQFDTSLIWYGKNIGVYQEVTQKSIDILENRLKQANMRIAGEAAMSISGDSVDIWDASRYFVITQRSPTQFISFDYESDPNWEKGDVYTLKGRLINQLKDAKWNLTVVYDDGAIETITSTIASDNPRRQELTLVTDSTRTAIYISGWINLEPQAGRPAIADSISLMRRRSSPALAQTRKYSQKTIAPEEIKKNEPTDTTASDTASTTSPKLVNKKVAGAKGSIQ